MQSAKALFSILIQKAVRCMCQFGSLAIFTDVKLMRFEGKVSGVGKGGVHSHKIDDPPRRSPSVIPRFALMDRPTAISYWRCALASREVSSYTPGGLESAAQRTELPSLGSGQARRIKDRPTSGTVRQ